MTDIPWLNETENSFEKKNPQFSYTGVSRLKRKYTFGFRLSFLCTKRLHAHITDDQSLTEFSVSHVTWNVLLKFMRSVFAPHITTILR